jgi:hypothetical protein
MTKDQFLRTDLCKFWGPIANSNDFETVLVYAQSAFMEVKPSADEIQGAQLFLSVLKDLPLPPEKITEPLPGPELIHDVDAEILKRKHTNT